MNLKQFIIPIIIFLVGTAINIIGALFRILHWEIGPVSSAFLLAIGSVAELIAIAIIIVVLMRYFLRKDN